MMQVQLAHAKQLRRLPPPSFTNLTLVFIELRSSKLACIPSLSTPTSPSRWRPLVSTRDHIHAPQQSETYISRFSPNHPKNQTNQIPFNRDLSIIAPDFAGMKQSRRLTHPTPSPEEVTECIHVWGGSGRLRRRVLFRVPGASGAH